MTGASRHILGLLLLSLALALPAAQKDRKQAAQQDLQALTERIERIQRQAAQDALKHDRISRDLRAAERSEASARSALSDLAAQRAARAAARQKLVDQRKAKQDELAQLRAQLADQMAKLRQDVAAIDELTTKIDAEDANLAHLEQQQKVRVGDLTAARQQRGQALDTLEQESRNRTAQLARLQQQQQELEQLLKQLSKATEAVPFDPNAPFVRARGSLSWPVAGHIAVDYGDSTVGNRRSNGIEIDTSQGAEVRAVHEGRVIFADYFGGQGLLIILDHGNGFYSLYGHNDQLFRQSEAHVQAGEVIATAGDSGGRKSPGLYFEIRRAGKPVDPHGWFRSRDPPAH